jgi:hypothetical protein
MRFLSGISALGAFFLLCVVGTTSAQIMKISTDNPSDNSVLKPSGTTLLTITLDPDYDSYDGYVTCGWSWCVGPGKFCPMLTGGEECFGYPDFPGRHWVDGYDIILTAVNGTVTWGTFAPADGAAGGQTATNTQVEFGHFWFPPTYGPFTVGTIPVTPSSPFVRIEFVRWNLTQRGTSLDLYGCSGWVSGFYILGNRYSPCFDYRPADWFDAEGVGAPMDACLAAAGVGATTIRNHGSCEVCCLELGGKANSCSKFCKQISSGGGEPLP